MLVERHGQADLPQVALAGQPPRDLPGLLHRGDEQGHERADDRQNDEQLDQRKAELPAVPHRSSSPPTRTRTRHAITPPKRERSAVRDGGATS